MDQLSLFANVSNAYANAAGALTQTDLYGYLQEQGLPREELLACQPVGCAGAPVAITKRRIRWMQQTLKQAGVIEPAGGRGVWQMTSAARAGQPSEIQEGKFILGFSTKLGIAVIADCRAFFSKISEPIHLLLSSPPYPLAAPRAYGNVSEREYVDWLCHTIEPAIKLMAPGASLCLNVGNDVFLQGSPARSLYQERLVLALADRFGLFKMDGLVWTSNKAPGPIAWASKKRVQLNTGYEMVYWFTNDPDKVYSDNQAVLEPHSERHLRFVRNGGHKTAARQCDGAHRKSVGSFSHETPGRIPRNVLRFVRTREDMDREYRAYCEAHGYVRHGASMPVTLASFLIQFLTRRGQLVADTFGGRMKTGLAAERLGRRWVCTEKMVDYGLGSRGQFAADDAFQAS